MTKHTSRVTGIVAMVVFAAVAITAAFAGTGHPCHAAESESTSAFASPTPPSEEAGKTVGTCNTAKGCKALKVACKSLKKHSFKATKADGSLGVCIDHAWIPSTRAFYLKNSNGSKEPHKTPAADVDLAAPKNTSEAKLYCQGTVMCLRVATICADLGGTFETNGASGACSY